VKRLFRKWRPTPHQVHERTREGVPEGAVDDDTPSPAGHESNNKAPASGLAPEKEAGGGDGPASGVGGEKGPASGLGGGQGPASGLASGLGGGRVSGRRAAPGEEVGPLKGPEPQKLHPKQRPFTLKDPES
jgi:hypothetical protein